MKTLVIIALATVLVAVSCRVQFRQIQNAAIHENIAEATGSRYRRSITNDGGSGNAAGAGVPTTLSKEEQVACVVHHNSYRSKEDAADELKLAWNHSMASLAQAWAEDCVWKHGMLYDFGGVRLGQNMFMAGGGSEYPTLDPQYAIEQWYVEKGWFHFADGSCDEGKMCGHYTQVVWAKTASVGCGYAKCPEVTVGDNVWTNAVVFVCDYTPAGNVQGQKLYVTGAPCSKCKESIGVNSGYKCDNNLCVPCTPRTDAECSCGSDPDPVCQNEGSYSHEDCVCVCAAGFYGHTCEKSCACKDLYVDVCPQWQDYCNDAGYYDFMKTNCPVTCGMCHTPDSCN